MRTALHLALALALIGIAGSIAAAYVPSGSVWVVNTTLRPLVVTKYKVQDGPSGGAYYLGLGTYIEFNEVQLRISGAFAPFDPMYGTQTAMLWIPAAAGKSDDYGVKCAFSTRKADPSLADGFRSALANFVYRLDQPLQNLTHPKVYKTSAVAYLGGTLEVLDAKAAGKGAGDVGENVGAGRYKVSFSGTMLGGPYAGHGIKGQIAFAFEDAPQD